MDIIRYQGLNYGSLILIEFAPISAISSFALSAKGHITGAGIVFFSGLTWTKIYCSEDTMGHHQAKVLDDNGETWQQTIVGFTPGDQDDIEAALLITSNNRYISRITRPDGSKKIVGTLTEPLDLKLDSDTQTQVSGPNGTTITFSGITGYRALIYTE